MGSELVSDLPPRYWGGADESSAPKTYTEQFYECFPYYLSLGMTYELFWESDPQLVKYYRKAHEIKKRERNQELWVQGAYFYEALIDVAPILHAFAKQGTKPLPYVSEPFPLTVKEQTENKEKKAKEKYEKGLSKVMSWVKNINSKNAGKEGENRG